MKGYCERCGDYKEFGGTVESDILRLRVCTTCAYEARTLELKHIGVSGQISVRVMLLEDEILLKAWDRLDEQFKLLRKDMEGK
jgi:hypothetical protein